MAQNPANAIIHLGHSSGIYTPIISWFSSITLILCLIQKGVVTLWSPNVKEPLVKVLCHKSALKSIAINQTGNYMITSGLDHFLNIWDLRNTYKQLKSVKLDAGASYLAFSQKNLIAAGLRNEVVILKHDLLSVDKDFSDDTYDILDKDSIYMKHRFKNSAIQNFQFCPFEDVLGVGHGTGITSLLIPGKNYYKLTFI